MLINEHRGIENAHLWEHAKDYSWEHALNYSQYVVSDTNKHFIFDLDRKLNPGLKFEPNFLTWLPNGK